MFRRSWLAPQPKRVLAVVHGFAEHSGRYDVLGQWFASRGLAVHAYDQRGHGRSQGARGHVGRFGEFLDDLEAFVELLGKEHSGLPVVLVGHSMGGLVVATYLCERQPGPGLTAAVTSGAALALSKNLPRWRIHLSRLLRSVAPRLRLQSGLDVQGLSRDPAVVRAYLEDPLVDREADPICPVQGSRSFQARVRAPASRLRTYAKLRHEIFNEPEHEDVFEDILEWIRGLPEAAS
jgi:alpha-beta hydrolase superfamily lysophospholipase